MADSFVATASVMSLSGVKFKVSSGLSDSEANAVNELKAKLKLMVLATVFKITINKTLGDITGYTAGSTGQFEDATIGLYKNGPNGIVLYRNVHIEDMSLAYQIDVTGSNLIDTTKADIQDFISKYRDGQGVGGYAAYPSGSHYEK